MVSGWHRSVVYKVRKPVLILSVGCGTGILPITVLRYGHPRPDSNPNPKLYPTNPNCYYETTKLPLFDEAPSTSMKRPLVHHHYCDVMYVVASTER